MGEMQDRQICIVGPRRLQNELVASFVTDQTGIATVTAPKLEHVPVNGSRSILVLKDCPPGERADCLEKLSSGAKFITERHILALFNVHPELAIEQEIANVAMYDEFLQSEIPEDVGIVFRNQYLHFGSPTLSLGVCSTIRNEAPSPLG